MNQVDVVSSMLKLSGFRKFDGWELLVFGMADSTKSLS
jgi:hypothetical protein